MRFRWDAAKAKRNLSKHRVSFDEAATVFHDPLAMIFPDDDHSVGERREIIVGRSLIERVLLVSFIELPEAIRIISASRADARERRTYEEGIQQAE